MWWVKTKSFIKKYSVALVAALTALLTIALGILITSSGERSNSSSAEELIKHQKETVDKDIKDLENQDKELAKQDKLAKDKLKDINEGSEELKKEVKNDVEKIDAADGLDELLHIQDELSKRNRD
jgi:predicted  nucleic acid-binding Zn-ribbon protein